MTTAHQIKKKRLGIKSSRDGEYHRQAVALIGLDGGTVAAGVVMRGIDATIATWTRVKVLLEHDPRVVVTVERIGETGRLTTYRAATPEEMAAYEAPSPPPKVAEAPKTAGRGKTRAEWLERWRKAHAHESMKSCRWYRHEVLAYRCGLRAKSAEWLRHLASGDVPEWVEVQKIEGHLHCRFLVPHGDPDAR